MLSKNYKEQGVQLSW